MCWLIDATNDVLDDPLAITLSDLYERCKIEIQNDLNNTRSDTMNITNLDRNSGEFELILRKMNKNKQDQITIKHVRFFAHCTSNLNPQLKAIVRQRRGVYPSLIDLDSDNINTAETLTTDTSQRGDLIDLGIGAFLFEDCSIWTKNELGLEKGTKALCKMSIEEVVHFIEKLSIKPDRLSNYIQIFYSNNLNGLVLQTCELDDLKTVLNVSFITFLINFY